MRAYMPRRNKPVKHARLEPRFDNCDSKRQYLTEREAKATAEYQMLINFDLELSVYKCNMCHKWHLTRQQKPKL